MKSTKLLNNFIIDKGIACLFGNHLPKGFSAGTKLS